MPELTALQLAEYLGISFDVVHKRRRSGKWPCLNPDAGYDYRFDSDVCKALYDAETGERRDKHMKTRADYKERERLRKLRWIAERNRKRREAEQ